MSRALDEDIIKLLKAGDPTQVYNQLSSLLDKYPDDRLLEIEILGSSYHLEPGVNYLQDGNAIAIPRLRLVQAFFVGVNILQELMQGMNPLRESVYTRDSLRQATGIILLMDPEHLAAANTRKRLLKCALGKISPQINSTEATNLFQREMTFVDSLLTSHLHRHTKSPTLWNHRRWVVEKAESYDLTANVTADIRKVVMVAASRHPRNYYAWNHARWLVERMLPPLYDLERRVEVGGDVVRLTKEWCFKNHSDTSGWSFLWFIGEKLHPEASLLPLVFSETLRFVRSFGWTNESVWVFLRTVAASNLVGDREVADFYESIQMLEGSGLPDGIRALRAAQRWVDDYKYK